MRKNRTPLFVTAAASVIFTLAVATARGDIQKDKELVRRYAPVIRLSHGELYRPEAVEIFAARDPATGQRPMLRDGQGNDTSVVKINYLGSFAESNTGYYLDLPGSSVADNKAVYNKIKDNFQDTIYARIVEDDELEATAIQYWFAFYCSSWKEDAAEGFNNHEADWEGITVFLKNGLPCAAAYAQHRWDEVREWEKVSRVDQTHPVVYPGLGSHASYFDPGTSVYSTVGSVVAFSDIHDGAGVELRAGTADLAVVLLPTITAGDLSNFGGKDFSWLKYTGKWGQLDLPNGTPVDSFLPVKWLSKNPIDLGNDGVPGPAYTKRWREPFECLDRKARQTAAAQEEERVDRAQ